MNTDDEFFGTEEEIDNSTTPPEFRLLMDWLPTFGECNSPEAQVAWMHTIAEFAKLIMMNNAMLAAMVAADNGDGGILEPADVGV